MKKGTIEPGKMGPVQKLFRGGALVKLLIIDGQDTLDPGPGSPVFEPGAERVGHLRFHIEYGARIIIVGDQPFESAEQITSVCMTDYGRIIIGTHRNHTYLLERMLPDPIGK